MNQILYSTLLILSNTVFAQIGSFNLGGRSAGLAGASLTLGDEYSLFNNIGGLGRVENTSGFVSYQNRYGIRQFQVIGAGAVYSLDIGSTGIGFYKFGDDLYSEQRVHVVVGNKIQMVSLAIGIDYLQYNISSIGNGQAFALQFGGIAEITSQLSFGAHIFNLNQAKINSESGERIPTSMKGGISYMPGDDLMLNLEIEKDLGFDEMLRIGIEYEIVENVFIRTGIATKPIIGAFGIGFHPKKLKFDYGFTNEPLLGNTHELSWSYSFRK